MYSADFISWNPDTQVLNRHKAVSARTKVPPPEPGRDFTKRVTCCEAHPTKEIVAVVSTAALFLYTGKNQ
jgi:serine/threonine-protein phosphatase 2A regulatory subunit B